METEACERFLNAREMGASSRDWSRMETEACERFSNASERKALG